MPTPILASTGPSESIPDRGRHTIAFAHAILLVRDHLRFQQPRCRVRGGTIRGLIRLLLATTTVVRRPLYLAALHPLQGTTKWLARSCARGCCPPPCCCSCHCSWLPSRRSPRHRLRWSSAIGGPESSRPMGRLPADTCSRRARCWGERLRDHLEAAAARRCQDELLWHDRQCDVRGRGTGPYHRGA